MHLPPASRAASQPTNPCPPSLQVASEGEVVADEDFLHRYAAAEGCAASAAERQRQSHLLDQMFAQLESLNERED